MSEIIPISKFIQYGFDTLGNSFGLVLIGIVFLIRSDGICWPSKFQKKTLAEYYAAKKENKNLTSDQEYVSILIVSNRAGWFFILLGFLFSIFNKLKIYF
ncbi:MAG: hypothetical protein LUQ11_12205 [Methylococcaceae bacterium]|nr:hypothetical protein [Methylococcaceae bacterium]